MILYPLPYETCMEMKARQRTFVLVGADLGVVCSPLVWQRLGRQNKTLLLDSAKCDGVSFRKGLFF